MYEELEPIDRNLNYDFNYQQINHLPHEVTIMPVSQCLHHKVLLMNLIVCVCVIQGDLIQLKCFYGTEGVDGVTVVSVQHFMHNNI